VTLSRREIQYRLQLGNTYPTEAELANIVGQFRTWHDLIQAGFPAVDKPAEDSPEAEPHDPRSPDEKLANLLDQVERRQAEAARQVPGQLVLGGEEWFPRDTWGPRSTPGSVKIWVDGVPSLTGITCTPGDRTLNTRTQLVVPADLAAAARRRAADLPADAGLAMLARYALARLAGWPSSAAVTVARGRPSAGTTAGDRA
jgi:hypothetical protein